MPARCGDGRPLAFAWQEKLRAITPDRGGSSAFGFAGKGL
jgi:hypothetical protein